MEAQQDVVDLFKEAHETTIIHSARYQQTLRRHHERKIKGRILEVGDFVLRRTQSTKEKHKLSIMGRTLYGDRGDTTGRLPTEGRQRRRSHQHLEHQTVTAFLPLKFGLYRFLSYNVRSRKAPRPEHFWPGSLEGSMRVRYHLSFLLSYDKYFSTQIKG